MASVVTIDKTQIIDCEICESLYTSQLNREDLKGDLKNVVKWSYVDSNKYSGKFLIVTCRWSTKIWKHMELKNSSWKYPTMSAMFTAGDNNELKWEIQLKQITSERFDCDLQTFEMNSLNHDYTLSLLRNDLFVDSKVPFDEKFTPNPTTLSIIEYEPEHLGSGGDSISILQGFIVDVTKFQNNKTHTLDSSNSAAPHNILEQLLANPLFSDVTLIIGEEQLKAHRAVLAMNSQIFKDILENYKKQESHIDIEMNDFQFDTIKEMLHFMYTGQLRDYGEESIKQILLVSSKYAIKNLFLKSQEALIKYLNDKNALEFLKLAGDVNATDLKSSSINVMVNNIGKIDSLGLSLLRPALLKEIFDKMSTSYGRFRRI